MRYADPTFGLNSQAICVATMLASWHVELPKGSKRPRLETFPWYNGRERGVVFISAKDYDTPVLMIAVFEHRNSDSICALRCVVDRLSPYDQPTMEHHGKLFYPTDHKFDDVVFQTGFGEVGKMAAWVRDEIDDHIDEGGAA